MTLHHRSVKLPNKEGMAYLVRQAKSQKRSLFHTLSSAVMSSEVHTPRTGMEFHIKRSISSQRPASNFVHALINFQSRRFAPNMGILHTLSEFRKLYQRLGHLEL